MSACNEGDIKTVELLIEAKANLNLSDEDGVTALIFAASNGHEEIVEALLNT